MITANFSLTEFSFSQTACRYDLDNTPPDSVMPAIKRTLDGLERVRLVTGQPVIITSGYRSPHVNRLVGGSAGSQHPKGEAADIICPKFGPPSRLLWAIAGSGIEYDQLILEYERWVHVSFCAKPRGQLLAIDSAGARML